MKFKSIIFLTGGFAIGILANKNKDKIKQYWNSFKENFKKVQSNTPTGTGETTQTSETDTAANQSTDSAE